MGRFSNLLSPLAAPSRITIILSGKRAEPRASFYADGLEEVILGIHRQEVLLMVICSAPRSAANAAILSNSGRIFRIPVLTEGDAGSLIVRSIMKNF